MSAPLDTKYSITARWPFSAAQCNAVHPPWDGTQSDHIHDEVGWDMMDDRLPHPVHGSQLLLTPNIPSQLDGRSLQPSAMQSIHPEMEHRVITSMMGWDMMDDRLPHPVHGCQLLLTPNIPSKLNSLVSASLDNISLPFLRWEHRVIVSIMR